MTTDSDILLSWYTNDFFEYFSLAPQKCVPCNHTNAHHCTLKSGGRHSDSKKKIPTATGMASVHRKAGKDNNLRFSLVSVPLLQHACDHGNECTYVKLSHFHDADFRNFGTSQGIAPTWNLFSWHLDESLNGWNKSRQRPNWILSGLLDSGTLILQSMIKYLIYCNQK